MAAETSQCSTYSSVPVKYEENVFYFKGQDSWLFLKLTFGKHHVTKRNLGKCPLLLGPECRRISASLKSCGNHLEKLQKKTEQIILPFQHKCITGELFLNLLIVRI